MSSNKEKKWSVAAERDLSIAVNLSAQGEKVKTNWAAVHNIMESLGYGFTEGSISQHWSKTIIKDFKSRHGNDVLKNSGATTSAKPTPKKTPTKRKGGKTENDDDDDDDTPASKRSKKLSSDTEVKKEEQDAKLVETQDREEAFNDWATGGSF